jgi:hypothetical protein
MLPTLVAGEVKLLFKLTEDSVLRLSRCFDSIADKLLDKSMFQKRRNPKPNFNSALAQEY